MTRALLWTKGITATALLVCALFQGAAFAESVVRGPYLQMPTPTSMVVRWRTDVATNSRVEFGTSQGLLNQSASDASSTTEHEIQLTGLNPNTRYYYSVGTSSTPLTGDDANTYFETNPTAGTATPTRIWVIGDAGTGTSSQAAVYNAYRTHTGSNYTDLWLMLGDNAYNSGTDSEFQSKMFNMYPELMRQTPFWSTLGNHDGISADSASETGPYYDLHTLPRNAEAGGVASGTEAYYSFDYANVHFIVLDSYETSRATNGAMMNWMKSDLQSTTADWVIAFWHHPPYSKGSHNSDTESNMVQMRERFVPELESYGVDLVLSGHSHAYERSKFIDGHYGTSATFNSSHEVDGGSGRTDGSGAYSKSGVGVANAGAVYAVAGSSGKISGGALNHPAMYLSLNELGSMVLEVDGLTLDAKFLNNNGTVRDYFTLSKGYTPPPSPPAAPSNMNAVTQSYNSIALSWTDNADNEASFQLQRSLDGNNWSLLSTLGANTTSHTDTGLQGSTTYYYRVRAVNAGGDSSYSNAANATTDAGSAPTTVYLRNGENAYAGNTDSYVADGRTSNNYGSSSEILADGSDGSNGRLMSVLKWDASAIPGSATVDSASVTLQVFNKSSGTYKLYAVNAAWSEGSVTYSSLDPLNNMGVEIGSFTPSSTGSKQITLNAAGIALVQDWVDDSGANNGFLIMDASSTDGLDMRSSEYGTVSQRPMLTVTYQ